MHILLIKTSSMGDIIHTLPALTDAKKANPSLVFDWVVEEGFSEIPRWHDSVNQVIPLALRRWRKNLFSSSTRAEWFQCRSLLKANQYDLIIDAQGLLKTSWLSLIAKGTRCGLDWQSAREPLASFFYQKKYRAGKIKEVHAVNRIRSLFSQVLGYTISPTSIPDYGIDKTKFIRMHFDEPYVVFLHGTTWGTKHWPVEYWIQLAKKIEAQGFFIKLPWGNPKEQERAIYIASQCKNANVLPRMTLVQIAGVLAGAQANVAVDTGLGHLAAALDVPTVSLYGPTNSSLTGAVGRSQIHLSATYPCSPCLNNVCNFRNNSSLDAACFETLGPEVVWGAVRELLRSC